MYLGIITREGKPHGFCLIVILTFWPKQKTINKAKFHPLNILVVGLRWAETLHCSYRLFCFCWTSDFQRHNQFFFCPTWEPSPLLRVTPRSRNSASAMTSWWRRGRRRWSASKTTRGAARRRAKCASTTRSSSPRSASSASCRSACRGELPQCLLSSVRRRKENKNQLASDALSFFPRMRCENQVATAGFCRATLVQNCVRWRRLPRAPACTHIHHS